ncbi:MAG: hypothetical protein DME50_10880, partial [Verrucomicrobia bacterium]
VGTQRAETEIEPRVEVADRVARVTRKPADAVDVCFAVRTITQVHLGQAKVGAMYHWLIDPLQQNDERVAGHLAQRLP